MSDTTEPALTPEEWAHPERGVDIGIGLVWAHLSADPKDETGDAEALDDKGPWLVIDASNICGHRFTVCPRISLAALALHGQPFGFTRADVAAIRRAIGYDPTTGDLSLALESLADRVEALLPPVGR